MCFAGERLIVLVCVRSGSNTSVAFRPSYISSVLLADIVVQVPLVLQLTHQAYATLRWKLSSCGLTFILHIIEVGLVDKRHASGCGCVSGLRRW